MPDKRQTAGFEGQVRCCHCERWIPRSGALHPEGEEYTVYFCGLTCYHAWREKSASDPRPEGE